MGAEMGRGLEDINGEPPNSVEFCPSTTGTPLADPGNNSIGE